MEEGKGDLAGQPVNRDLSHVKLHRSRPPYGGGRKEKEKYNQSREKDGG